MVETLDISSSHANEQAWAPFSNSEDVQKNPGVEGPGGAPPA